MIAARVPPLVGEERVPLLAARGRVLARDLRAPGDLPPFRNSAVDGYAFAFRDLGAAGAWLPVSGRIAAGQGPGRLPSGTAVRIFTGAPMPEGADTVAMQEDVVSEGNGVRLPSHLRAGEHCRLAGEDVARGALALPAGRPLSAPEIGLAAALGLTDLPVRRRPRIGVFSTGNELAEPGRPLGEARIFDSNRPLLLALLASLPVEAHDLGRLPDQSARTRAGLEAAAASHDLLLTSGGVSAGEEDHVRAAIEAAGHLTFWRLAVKPGRPVAMGVVRGTPVLGLPGNPVAAMVTFLLVACPLALRLAGAEVGPLLRVPAVADFVHRKKPGRREYLRVSLRQDAGTIRAAAFPREGSALLTSLTESDAFAELDESVTGISPGDPVLVLPFRMLF